MSFIHELSQATAQAQRAYDLESERLVQSFIATQKGKFMRACREAAQNQKNDCCIYVELSLEMCRRGVGVRQEVTCCFDAFLSAKVRNELREAENEIKAKIVMKQKLQAMLVELGFQDGKVQWQGHPFFNFRVSAKWPVADAACSQDPSPDRAGGTCITCPICQEHRPAVVLIPCGHVVCRDCQRCQQFRQCPMCRRPISSASDGLFMD